MKAEIKRRVEELESYQQPAERPTQILIYGIDRIDGSPQATSADRLGSEGPIVHRRGNETEREFLTRAEEDLFEGVQTTIIALPAKNPRPGEKS